MYVIGTAGHVDHGKSALVEALTGIDPDRLREEKERGLTIDLGFAWLTLPNGEEVSIVDVPGHERFIKNMLAGVGGIDLAIIDLLGIEHGVVAVAKADLVEPELAELAAADVEEALRGTTLEGAPTVVCSAVTRQGLDELVATLQTELARTPAKRDIGRPRLPIDRGVPIAGFGTVVTGTLIAGWPRGGRAGGGGPGGAARPNPRAPGARPEGGGRAAGAAHGGEPGRRGRGGAGAGDGRGLAGLAAAGGGAGRPAPGRGATP